MIRTKKFDLSFFAKALILIIFAYFCIEYKTFEHRLYHIMYKLVSPTIAIPSKLTQDYPFFLTDILILLLFLLTIAYQKRFKSIIFEKGSLIFFLFVVVAWVSIFTCPYEKDLTRFSRAFSLFFSFLFFISVRVFSKQQFIKYLLVILMLFSAFETILTIYQYFFQKPLGLFKLGEPKVLKNVMECAWLPSYNGKKWIFDLFRTDHVRLLRSYGTFSHPNILSCFLMTSILGSIYFWIKEVKLKKIGMSIFIFFQIVALVLTFSRASFITTVAVCMILIFMAKRIGWGSKFLHSLIIICFFVANVVVFQPVLSKRGSFEINNKFSKGSTQERINCTMLALRIIKKHYIRGLGLDHFMRHAEKFKSRNEAFKVTTTIHNIYLLIAAEMGLIGLLLFLSFLLLVLKKIDLSDDLLATLVMIFIGYLILGMADYYFLYTQKGKILFFGIAGLICGYSDYLQNLKLAQREGCDSILYSKELIAKC